MLYRPPFNGVTNRFPFHGRSTQRALGIVVSWTKVDHFRRPSRRRVDRESQHRLGRQQEAVPGLGRDHRSHTDHVRHLRSHGSLSGLLQ